MKQTDFCGTTGTNLCSALEDGDTQNKPRELEKKRAVLSLMPVTDNTAIYVHNRAIYIHNM